ncbi:MAG: hypothetical protein ABI882_21125 [Acidobacteriota bacterium]
MALNTEEPHQVSCQEFRIGGSVRRVTGLAAFDLDRRVLEDKWTLLVGVAFDARRIAIDRVAERLAHKATVLVVAIGALHSTLRHFVMERLRE